MNRKYLWLTAITLPGVLMSGCWAGLHQFAIHTFEVTDFVAALGCWASSSSEAGNARPRLSRQRLPNYVAPSFI